MPAPDVVAVVALAPVPGRARGAADTVEVVEVAARAAGGVLVIPDRRTGQGLDPPPARAIGSQVGLERPDEIGGVLLVVADDRGHRVLVEAPHLLGVARQHAEQEMARQVRGRSPSEYGVPTGPKRTDVEIAQARNLDVECLPVWPDRSLRAA